MSEKEIRETLEKQLQLLSERSESSAISGEALEGITREMRKLALLLVEFPF